MSDKEKYMPKPISKYPEEYPVSREKLMEEIQAVGFALVELNLYLDTHPWDQKALGDFNSLSQQYRVLVFEYEKLFGPLYNHGYSMSPYPWRWNDPPWPWQM